MLCTAPEVSTSHKPAEAGLRKKRRHIHTKQGTATSQDLQPWQRAERTCWWRHQLETQIKREHGEAEQLSALHLPWRQRSVLGTLTTHLGNLHQGKERPSTGLVFPLHYSIPQPTAQVNTSFGLGNPPQIRFTLMLFKVRWDSYFQYQ